MPLHNQHRCRFLCLGDSYTIGELVAISDRWPVQLVALLRKEHIEVDDPTFIAATGWTTADLIKAIEVAPPPGTYDLVSLLVGVNNQYQGRSIEEYRREFAGLLNQAIRFAGRRTSHVIVLSIPDWGVTPFAEGRKRDQIRKQIDAFNAVNHEEAGRAGVQYFDVTGISRSAGEDGTLLAPDALHPSGKMYEQWARLVLSRVMSILRAE